MSKHEVWVTQGQGECFAEKCETLADALKVVSRIHANEPAMGVGIKLPDGEWYDWGYEIDRKGEEAEQTTDEKE